MRYAWIPGLILFGGVFIGTSAHATHRAPICYPLRATLTARFSEPTCGSPVGLCTQGTFEWGLLRGTTSFGATGLAGGVLGEPSIVTPAAEPPSTWAYSGVLEIRTSLGDLVFSDVGILDNAAGTFTELERPVSGTRFFQGVTGRAFISGTTIEENNAAVGFEGDVTGELCVPRR